MQSAPQSPSPVRLLRWRYWIAAFLLGAGWALLASAPAALLHESVNKVLQTQTRGKVVASSVTGSVWASSWTLLIDRHTPLSLEARISLLPLWRGRLGVTADIVSPAANGLLQGELGMGTVSLDESRLQLDAATLAGLLGLPAEADGQVALRIGELTWQKGWADSLDASLAWSGGTVKVANKPYRLPPISIRPGLEGNQIRVAPVTEGVDGELAEVILYQDRRMKVVVFQRGAALVDASISGEPGKAVFQLERLW